VKVIRHPMRYLVNMSHPEMEAVVEIFNRGLADLVDDPNPPLSTSAKKSAAYWMPKAPGKRPRNPFRLPSKQATKPPRKMK
jgi:hypothetical protein